MSPRTCGMACWTAKSAKCTCSCGGANHGILRPKGSGDLFRVDVEPERLLPMRKRRVADTWFKLGHVVAARVTTGDEPGFPIARHICKDWYGEPDPVRRKPGEGQPRAFMERVSGAAHKRWPETRAYPVRPWLVWVRDDIQLELGEEGA